MLLKGIIWYNMIIFTSKINNTYLKRKFFQILDFI